MDKVLLVMEKYCNRIFDISTPELSEKAYLALFREMDKLNYYDDLVKMESEIYKKAKEGNGKLARNLVKCRSRDGYEYEYVEEIVVE